MLRAPLAAASLGLLLAAVITPPAAVARQRTVHLRGTAYEFNNVRTRLAGATIRVAELPRIKATVRPGGAYDLVVPDRARVTPYIVAPGYHTIYLQTFTTAGEDISNVNFQTPSDLIYRALAGLLSVPLDPAGNLSSCAIVSTFSTVHVRDLSFAGFIGYGAHGVGGATASASPTLPAPVYFNESVVPDRMQAVSSRDGGVIWTDVPAGVYTITAHHPTTRFASFVATCKPGRIVNANPPWGLHELAPASPAKLTARWLTARREVTLRSLRARNLPADSVLRVRCSGSRCPFTSRALRARADTLDVARALGSRARRLHAGQTLEVGIFAHGYDGKVLRWRIPAARTPRATTLCVPLGTTKPRARCAGARPL